MCVHSRHQPQRVHRTVMKVVVVAVVSWACLLSLFAQTSAAQVLLLRAEDLLAGSASDLVRSGSTVPSSCTIPEGRQGVCGTASSCPEYQSLLNQLQNDTVLDFFRKRVCRHSPGLVHVCCPPAPKQQSSSIFFLRPSKTPESSSGSSFVPSQRPNARQPSQPGLIMDNDDEKDETKEFPNASPTQSTFQPTLQSSVPTQVQPLAFPQLPQGVERPTTLATATGVFSSPNREPSVRVPFTSTTPVPQNHQPPTEPPEPTVLPAEGVCGTKVQGRTDSTPWVVGVGVLKETEFQVRCGGALVSSRHVIAAAHCLQDPTPSHVRLGDPLRQEHMEDVQLLTWTTAGYDPDTHKNDLALLTLTRPVTFTDNIRPVCLPFRYRFDGFRGQALQVVGWGSTGDFETKNVEILGSEQCSASYSSTASISNNNHLFSDSSSSRSSSSSSFSTRASPRSFAVTVDRQNLCGSPALSSFSMFCLSDHGAPIFFHDEETTGLYFLAGVSSIGDSCHEEPGLYTRLGAFIPWLSQQLS